MQATEVVDIYNLLAFRYNYSDYCVILIVLIVLGSIIGGFSDVISF